MVSIRRSCCLFLVWACAWLLPGTALAQGPLTNGAIHQAAISAPGEIDVWTFTATQGDSILVNVGEVLLAGPDPGFSPWIQLQNPSGVLMASSFGGLAAAVDVVAPVSGTYTVLLSSGDAGRVGMGTYRLALTKIPGTFSTTSGDEGGVLDNGVNTPGTIYVGDVDTWTFTANKDDFLSISGSRTSSDANFVPWVRLYGPTGALLSSSFGGLVGQVSVTAPLSGAYTVIVASGDPGLDGNGTYNLTLARAPATFTISPGDEGGPMTNGRIHTGHVAVGDLDMWSFTANKNDYLVIGVGELPFGEVDPGFSPWLRIVGPNGALLSSTFGGLVAQASLVAPLSGPYTVILGSGDPGLDGAGDYRLNLVRAPATLEVSPGDEGGTIVSGANYRGHITTGDLDAWTFDANKNDFIVLSAGEPPFGEIDPGYSPWLRLFGPDGAYIGDTFGGLTAQIALAAPLTGKYTVVVGTGDPGLDAEGDYRLTLARPPGGFDVNNELDGLWPLEPTDNDGGALTNGATHHGTIRMGDLDQWTIAANINEHIVISVGEPPFGEVDPGFSPWIRVVGPNGALVGSTFGSLAASLDITAPLSGSYTAIVGTGDPGLDAVGSYKITVVKTAGTYVTSPGDQGSPLATDETVSTGSIYRGDLDPWTFAAPAGATITVRMTEHPFVEVDPGFSPWLMLFSPSGALIGSQFGTNSVTYSVTAPTTGTYTVIARSGDPGLDGEGDYDVALHVVPVTYTVTSFAGANGAINPSGAQTVAGGSVLTFAVMPSAGFQISSVTGCGGTLTGSQFTTAPIAASCTVSAVFATAPQRTVTPSAGPNGTISPSTPQTVTNGQTRAFTLTPASGYVIDTVGGTCGGSLAGTVFTTSPVTANCTVAAAFKQLPPPVMALDRARLVFGAVSNGATFTAQTRAQLVRLTQSGPGVVTWAASPSQPWLHVSPASGTGPADLTVTVSFAPGLPAPASMTGAIAFTFTGAANNPGPIDSTLKVTSVSAAPDGFFDTPVDHRTGVTGAVPFTGWAVDDIGISRVAICRAAVAGENAPVDPNCGGWAEIFIGLAVMIDGARPDVAKLYADYPVNTAAGWGLMVLTNMLPNQGNGTYVFHAWAQDLDGHATLLGTRTMTCANALAALPFGAIDTPAQGGTVSGSSYVNFGWALTPQPKTIPTDGSTITVLVDGLSQGSVTYNNYRSDIATLFPGLNNSNAAVGFKVLDTTALANGRHTIVWVVTDDHGATEGIGSRFFTVSNSGAATRETYAGAPASAPVDAELVAALPLAGAMTSRRGFDLDAPFEPVATEWSGQHVVRAEEVDRIELTLGAEPGRTVAGYLRTADGLAALPIGWSLDAGTGRFIWAPGVGFVGSYDFVFVMRDGTTPVARQEVRIVLQPKGRGAVGAQVIIDTPTRQQDVGQPFMLAGWAADLGATTDTGITTVHVWAYPLTGAPPIFLGVAEAGRRPDVAAVYGAQFADAGYGLIVDGLTPGNYDLAVFAGSAITGDFLPATVVRVTVR